MQISFRRNECSFNISYAAHIIISWIYPSNLAPTVLCTTCHAFSAKLYTENSAECRVFQERAEAMDHECTISNISHTEGYVM